MQPEEQKINSAYFKEKFAENPDVAFNEITVGKSDSLRVTVAFIDGMVSSQLIDDYVLKPLYQEGALARAKSQAELVDLVMLGAVYHCQRKLCHTLSESMQELLSGSAIVIFDDCETAAAFDVKGFDKRGISEPSNEGILKGSKEAFIEVMRTNTALVRRRIQSESLMINILRVGRHSNTAVSIVYLDGTASSDTITAIKERLKSVDFDGICSAGQLEALLLGRRNSVFPQLLYTERVDKFCGNILEGRVGLLIDGLPMAYICPVDFVAFFQAPEDYAHGHIVGSLLRILRFACAFIALVLPALYVSMTTFNQEMLPTALAITIIGNARVIPFPTYMEVLLLIVAFEILLEAALRLPQPIGQSVSIAGGLVVGQAAIFAGLLSPGVVMIVATACIAGFVLPSQDLSATIRIFRVVLILLSIVAGLFGLILGVIAILYRMSAMEAFGTPYLSPFAGTEGRGMFRDTIVRASWGKSGMRPVNIHAQNPNRQSRNS